MTTPITARELDSRSNDGIHVQLLWCEHDGRLWVSVADSKATALDRCAIAPRRWTCSTTPSATPPVTGRHGSRHRGLRSRDGTAAVRNDEMATPTHRDHAKAGEQRNPPVTARLAVGVDGYPEGRDAAALGAAISRATGAATMLVAVHPDPMFFYRTR